MSKPCGPDGHVNNKVLTGDRQDAAHELAASYMPKLSVLVDGEVSRLRHAYESLTPDGKGVDLVAAFAEEIGVDAGVLETFMRKHPIFRNHTYLSDPYISRDLFKGSRTVGDFAVSIPDVDGPSADLQFIPATTWSKPGDGVFRFAIMYRYIQPDPSDALRPRRVRKARVPVVMIDSHKLDQIIDFDGRNSPVLEQLHALMATACHDYIHATCLMYLQNNAPEGMQGWDDRLAGGKQIWRESPSFNYNYEVLASVGHRKVMERVYKKYPEVKERVIERVALFSEAVDNLCAAMRHVGHGKDAKDMERYLMTNYMRFAYHILKPDDPGLAWVKKRYTYLERDLNLHNGKGLVALIHAHDGVPGKDTGDKDVTFNEWLNAYVTGHIPVMDRNPHYLTHMEQRLLEIQKQRGNKTEQGGGRY